MPESFASIRRCALSVLCLFVPVATIPARAATAGPDSVCLADLDRVQARMAEFDRLYAKCRVAGIALDYPAVAKTTLEQFIPLAWKTPGAGRQTGPIGVEGFADDTGWGRRRDDGLVADPSLAPNARHLETGGVETRGLTFVGSRVDAQGRHDRGPVFFCGYGHFTQVRKDMQRWPAYGVNIIQIELGPANTLVGENEVSLREAEAIIKVLDEAAKRNVRVDILLSPHYFPGWAYAKSAELSRGGAAWPIAWMRRRPSRSWKSSCAL